MKNRKKVIELRGVEFVNKGAELMLMTIVSLLRSRYGKEVILVMEVNPRVPIKKLRENDIYVKFNFKRFGINWQKLVGLTPWFLHAFKFVLPREVNIVLDASGFAYGDQWGAQYAHRRMGKFVKAWKSEGKKIILLPQAFGPFTKGDLKSEMAMMLDNVDLVFAREKQSYSYLKGISASPHLFLAPDFTNLIKGVIPADFDANNKRVAIVPNYKMIEHVLDKQGYLNFLKWIGEFLVSKDAKPYFLIHEGSKDRLIAEEANSLLKKPLNIVHYEDPLAVKGIISTADFIICSRFHGVVSALSQAVPCIATSWSHKYEMLMEEYDMSYGLVKDLTSLEEIEEKILFFLDGENRSKIKIELKENGLIQRSRAQEAWDKVFTLID